MGLTVSAYIFQAKTLRKEEIELHGRKLPGTAQCIDQLDINLRTVESRFTRYAFVGDASSLQGGLKTIFCHFPKLSFPRIFRRVLRVPGREVHFVFVEPKNTHHQEGKIDAGAHFCLHVFRRAEDVGIILSEAADPEQSMHYP